MKMTVLRFFLMLFLGGVLLVATFLWMALRTPSHLTDYLTLWAGQTTVAKLTCPAENYQWDGAFRLAEGASPIPAGPSQIVMRLKNEGAHTLHLEAVVGHGGLELPSGKTTEIYRGPLDGLLDGGRLKMFSDDRKDAHVELQIDSTFAQEKPLKIDIRWFYTHYSF